MIKLFLVRHGESEWNQEKKYQGQRDIPLSREGEFQALQLRKRFEKLSIDSIYSSDLKRAQDTAKIMICPRDISISINADLREMSLGTWEGYTKEDLLEKYNKPFNMFLKEPYHSFFPGEGSFKSFEKRVHKAISHILSYHKQGNIVIVSHSGVLKIIILLLMHLDFSFYKKFWLGNASVSIIYLKENQENILSLLNDMHHLNT